MEKVEAECIERGIVHDAMMAYQDRRFRAHTSPLMRRRLFSTSGREAADRRGRFRRDITEGAVISFALSPDLPVAVCRYHWPRGRCSDRRQHPPGRRPSRCNSDLPPDGFTSCQPRGGSVLVGHPQTPAGNTSQRTARTRACEGRPAGGFPRRESSAAEHSPSEVADSCSSGHRFPVAAYGMDEVHVPCAGSVSGCAPHM